LGYQITEDKMGWACSMYRGEYIEGFGERNLKEDYLNDHANMEDNIKMGLTEIRWEGVD